MLKTLPDRGNKEEYEKEYSGCHRFLECKGLVSFCQDGVKKMC